MWAFDWTLGVGAAWGLALGGVAAAWWLCAVRLWQVDRVTPTLAALPDAEPADAAWPRLSVIVPARNEAAGVEPALRSLLAQDYPALEVIAVDDRSDDGTGAILERLAGELPRLRVLHVERLPPGWLGKTHALQWGAGQAAGELLLFTDADVVFAPGALRATVAFLRRHGLGHLVAGPRLLAAGYWERAFLAAFAIAFVMRCRLWALRRARSAAYVGIGAFNLVRRADYDRVGGHARLALTVVDDVRLGLLLRRSGVPQGYVTAPELLSVRWQSGFWATLRGLLKNVYADLEFRWPLALGSIVVALGTGLLPWAGLVWAPGMGLRALALAGILPPLLLHGLLARRTAGGSGLEGLGYPIACVAFAGVIALSALVATVRGGLRWRDTVYPLDGLRAGALRERDLSRRDAVGW